MEGITIHIEFVKKGEDGEPEIMQIEKRVPARMLRVSTTQGIEKLLTTVARIAETETVMFNLTGEEE